MLTGENTLLTTLSTHELDAYIHAWDNISSRGDYFPHTLFPDSFWRKRFAENGMWGEAGGHLMIKDKDGKFIGSIFFFKPQVMFDYLEIGYILFNEEAKRQGHTSEALALLTNHLFKTKPLNKLLLHIRPTNTGSRKVAEKNGYVNEGVDRGAVFSHGAYQDVVRYGLLRDEWENIARAR